MIIKNKTKGFYYQPIRFTIMGVNIVQQYTIHSFIAEEYFKHSFITYTLSAQK